LQILTTVLSITLISVSLAVIISIAERFLNNYGECEIDINKGNKVLKVTGGSSLLSSLAAQKIFIPSACGGKATCGLCKVAILDGAGPVLPTEEPYLSKDEIAGNFRLSCQVKVKRNLKILIPEELFSIREYVTTIEELTDLTHDIKFLRLKLMPGEQITFKAGQYVQLHTKPYGKIKDTVFRAYSVASAPSDQTHVDLIVRLVPEGICTTYVHTALKVGDTVSISGPYGDFYLRGNCREIVMIAGGSGLAPMRSIILDVLEKKLDLKMVFFFGAVTKKDLYYLDYFAAIAADNPNFTFIPALSKPEPTDEWTGELGLITEVVARHVPDAIDRESYLCGSPGMINACLKVLDSKGFASDKIYFDKF
jgi:Na+-transporting NADH:ubiquinone oxidoreductase subunit F